MGCSQSTLATEPEVLTPPVLVEVPASASSSPVKQEGAAAPEVNEVVEEPAAEVEGPQPEEEQQPEAEQQPEVEQQPEPTKAFVILEETIVISGVVHYIVQDASGQKIHKRYSAFKQLHDTLCKVEGCEGMPQAGVWTALQRTSQALVADRRAKFEALMNEWAAIEANKEVLAAFMTE
ncbi:hypothetical protein AC1031_011585 [Aphanomyces cochlioides]|nr:hypothetical protein AC1031_011585 [Aphanomyces cochlioides]